VAEKYSDCSAFSLLKDRLSNIEFPADTNIVSREIPRKSLGP
jgi:hypothetical protein